MDNQEILSQLTPVFRKVFDNDSVTLTESSSAKDIEEWDSITHIQLIVAIEKHFKITFTAGEIRAFENVGQLCEAIKTKLNK